MIPTCRRRGRQVALVWTLAVATIAVTTLFSAAVAALADDPPSGFTVLPLGDVVLTRAGTAALTVVNGTRNPVSVEVTVALRDEDGKPLDAHATPDRLTKVEAGASAVVTLDTAESGTGVVIVTAVGPGRGTPFVVQRTVKSAPNQLPDPAVTSWEFTDDPLWLHNQTQIPLAKPCGDTKWSAKVTLAGSGRSVVADVVCDASNLKVSYPLTTQAGTYKGTLKISDDISVAITLTRTLPFWIAGFLVLLGAAVTWWATAQVTLFNRLRGLRRDLTSADKSVADAKEEHAKSQPRHGAKARGAIGYLRLRDVPALDKLEMRYPQKRHGLKPYLAAVPTAELAAVSATVESIQTDAKSITGEPSLLNDLEGKLSELDSLLPAAGDGFPLSSLAERYFEAPWVFAGASLDDISRLTAILGASGRIAELKKALNSLPIASLEDYQASAVFRALKKLEANELLIRSAAEPSTPLQKGLDDDLRIVEAMHRVLMSSASIKDLADAGVAPAPPVALPYVPLPAFGLLERLASSARAQAALLRERVPNMLLFVVAFAAALLAAYAAFYVDKPWGYGIDWLAALIYGATTLAASLTLSTYFGDLVKTDDNNITREAVG